ncbi:MAG: DUF3467 domain-containing protein [Candidatus Marinimicrobia bacterium]|nr:DUF3467 domain-containing protein [Candidatus Neomarinimicrobiota bacterium]
MNKDNKNTKRIEININEKTAQGKYANLQIVTHSPGEFILDFCQVLPGLPKAQVISRMILSPQHAKALMKTLGANIARYEQNFGEIKELQHAGQPQLQFQPEKEEEIVN